MGDLGINADLPSPQSSPSSTELASLGVASPSNLSSGSGCSGTGSPNFLSIRAHLKFHRLSFQSYYKKICPQPLEARKALAPTLTRNTEPCQERHTNASSTGPISTITASQGTQRVDLTHRERGILSAGKRERIIFSNSSPAGSENNFLSVGWQLQATFQDATERQRWH